MLETVKFIRENKDWREKLKQAPYCISINEDENYALLKYSQIDSDFNEIICRECRGLIIDLNTLTPKALSFYKFFNIGEEFADKIYWKDCKVTEKIDGTKILLWYDDYKHKWRISTSSMLDAKDAKVGDFGITFEDLFNRAITENLGEDILQDLDSIFNRLNCYTFELVSPESRVVVPYKQTKLYFIGARDITTFNEVPIKFYDKILSLFPTPKIYNLNTAKACLDSVEHMTYDHEGYVVVDKYFNRVKIKSPAYVQAHYLRGNGKVSKGKILEIIEKNEQDEFLAYFPEYKDYFKDIENRYDRYKEEASKAIIRLNIQLDAHKEDWTRKEIASYINKNEKEYSALLFNLLGTDLYKLYIENEWKKLTKEQKMIKLGFKEE